MLDLSSGAARNYQARAKLMRERDMLSKSEQRVLLTFRQYLITPGQMLCFSGPKLEQDKATLELLSDRDYLVKEEFKGGYSLTQAGYVAMNGCE